jgi:peptidoglycan biosynthesis protein MviN/MurJ (putative lipid II flippase)
MNFGYIGIVLASVISSYFNLTLLITILIKKKHFRFEKNFFKKFVLIFIPALAMALTLYLLRELFAKTDELGRVAELFTMIAVGLIIYFITSYFSGSLDILLKSHILRRKKNDAIPSA